MSNKQALLDCTFGWGKTCHLYADSIEIAGKSYNLEDLTAIRPTFRTILGVPSARLELYFGPQRLVLRGIPDQETARLMVAHLRPYCTAEPCAVRARSRTGKTRSVAREQARAWERSTKLPAISVSPAGNARDNAETLKHPIRCGDGASGLSFDDLAPAPLFTEDESFCAQGTPSETSEQESEVSLPLRDDEWPLAHSRSLHTPRFQPPLRSVHLVPPGQKVQDTCSLPVPAVKSSVLPVIHVPVRLQPGECAHYSIGASLCSDRISGSDRAPYPPLDHGLLILTNRRIFYIGKRSQLILAYTHLWYVSLLHNAIALHIEQQFRRIIIELEHPQEWASRIEQLSFIARRARPRPELPTLLMTALPGLSPSSLDATTFKRPAIKAPVPRQQEASPVGTSDASSPSEQVEPKIVEAQTISLAEQPAQDCADMKTQDFPLLPERTARADQKEASRSEPAPETPRRMAIADARTQDLPRTGDLAEAATQDFPQTGDLAEAATQDFRPAGELEDITTQELLPLPAEKGETPAGRSGDVEAATSTLSKPALPCSWDEQNCEEVDTLPLHEKTTDELEDEEPTLSLRAQRPARVRLRVQDSPVSDKLPDIEVTPRCLSQVREARKVPYKK